MKKQQTAAISHAEFLAHLDDPEMVDLLDKLELSPDQVKESHFFQLIDHDHSGTLDLDEVRAGCLRLMGNAKAVDLAGLTLEIREAHREFVEFREFTESCINFIMRTLASKHGNKHDL